MTQDDAELLEKALKDHFAAQVEMEQVAPGRFRFNVVSATFEGIPHLHRQDEVWRIVDCTLPTAVRLDVSLIIAFAPSELQVAP